MEGEKVIDWGQVLQDLSSDSSSDDDDQEGLGGLEGVRRSPKQKKGPYKMRLKKSITFESKNSKEEGSQMSKEEGSRSKEKAKKNVRQRRSRKTHTH